MVRSIRSLALCLALVLAIAGPALAQEESSTSKATLEAMTRRAGTLRMTYPDAVKRAAPELIKSPVLRCNDPTREEMDGAVWLWLEGQRPVAALCLLLYSTRGKWNYEHISLTDEAVAVTGRPTWAWEPKATPRSWKTLADPVPDSMRARQSALRSIARQLEASEVRRGETFPLRLLERPIYTYADEKQGILTGALFAMSYGTNPELLVQIEARTIDGKPAWQVGFARMSAAAITVKMENKELWKVEAMTADDPRGSYYGVNELATDE